MLVRNSLITNPDLKTPHVAIEFLVLEGRLIVLTLTSMKFRKYYFYKSKTKYNNSHYLGANVTYVSR